MSAQQIITELKSLGSESIKKVLGKHGAKEPYFGVKVEDLKKIQKRIKKDHALGLLKAGMQEHSRGLDYALDFGSAHSENDCAI